MGPPLHVLAAALCRVKPASTEAAPGDVSAPVSCPLNSSQDPTSTHRKETAPRRRRFSAGSWGQVRTSAARPLGSERRSESTLSGRTVMPRLTEAPLVIQGAVSRERRLCHLGDSRKGEGCRKTWGGPSTLISGWLLPPEASMAGWDQKSRGQTCTAPRGGAGVRVVCRDQVFMVWERWHVTGSKAGWAQ